MAVSVASALGVDKLLFLTDVDGVRGPDNQILPTLNLDQCRQLIDDGIATGGMRAKLDAAAEALDAGIDEVVIAPGATPGILDLLAKRLSDHEPVGTRLVTHLGVPRHA